MNPFARVLSLVALLAVAACTPLPHFQSGQEHIGTVATAGPNVLLNGARPRDGDRVFDGDTLTTGAGTSVRVYLREGGYVQLDENTDPEFRIFREGGCILIRMLTGQIFVDARRVCISDPNIEVALNSRVNVQVADQQTTLTVIEGEVTMSRPVRRNLDALHRYSVLRGAIASAVRLSPAQAERTASWTTRYFGTSDQAYGISGWCCTASGLSRATEDVCEQAEGRFSLDERTARRSCATPPSEPVWCCARGRVAQLTAERCAAARGQAFDERDAALDACSRRGTPSAVLGWCCRDGGLARLTEEICRQAGGSFTIDERIARRSCVPPAPDLVWCCARGKVAQTTPEGCAARQGLLFDDPDAAWAACAQRPPPTPSGEVIGWCCAGGRLARTTAEDCRQTRGRFSLDESSARRSCVAHPLEPGWCCIRGQVSSLPAERCRAMGGRDFADETSAHNACPAPAPSGQSGTGSSAPIYQVLPLILPPPAKSGVTGADPAPTVAPGWCCIGESLSPETAARCRAAGGRYYDSEREARRACTLR
ncbi:hypothetical protein [Accumulibacter sp.]|uniref:FecR domain-containing protein n=1 Tax=Accumulibacter sp. TaxID=2053492 RepID=UPI0025F50C86|nr:hypothetical protein [Accumulibacter sp.]MCM8626750.1 FecR family protein [Accumulibacter sp.]